MKYNYYRYRSGRDQYLKNIWGDKKVAKSEAHLINMIQRQDGPVLQNQSSLVLLWRKKTGVSFPSGRK
jgi:hypothetical protein